VKNLRIDFPLVDGSSFPLEFNSGEEMILHLIGDDTGPPVRGLSIEATTKDGKIVRLWIPNDERDEVGVEIE